MGIARSMRRKAEREKLKQKRPQGDLKSWTPQQVSQETGVKVQEMMEWLEANAREAQDEMAGNMARLLWEAEDYIATANLVIMLHTILRTFGSLKTVQKGLPKLMRNLNDTMDMVDEMGIKEASEALKPYGVILEFDDFDIRTLFDDPGKASTIMCRMKARWRIK